MTEFSKSQSERVENAWLRLQMDWPTHQDVTTMEIMNQYNKWDLYDEDMVTLGYQGARSLVNTFKTLNLPKEICILDVGCGTGLSGVELKSAGYQNIDAHDGSSLLLEYAKKKNAYKNMHCFLIGDNTELPISDGLYDVVLGAGIVAPGHLTPSAVINLFRLIKPGGYFGHSTRSTHLKREFSALAESMILQGKIEKVLEVTFSSIYENVSTDMNLEGTVQFFHPLN